MDYLLIFILTICSCLIFDNLGFMALVRNLVSSYKEQFKTMSNKELDDEAKQKALLGLISKQMGYLVKLIFSILLFVAPFALFFLVERFFPQFDSSILYRVEGIGISILAVVLYIIFKKQYVRLHKNRKNPT
ncbi:hypothetical protein [Maribacter sp. 2307UL18-2]|uniref:hypothetical protein n=1 Tax=Maribacter sp. 2307UL18-2 TaxID=3386274 RepID=UPI0039BD6535